jgi:rubredoxin
MNEKICNILLDPCPNCGKKELKVERIGYSYPAVYFFSCKKCGYGFSEDDGEGVKVLTQEESIRKRPHLWLDHEDPKIRKMAEEAMIGEER